MDRNTLKQALLLEGYKDNPAIEATLDRLLNLQGNPAAMLEAWLADGVKPSFEAIEGVDSDFLRSKLQMKNPAVILAYSMLLEDPKENAGYFKHLSENIIGFYPPHINRS